MTVNDNECFKFGMMYCLFYFIFNNSCENVLIISQEVVLVKMSLPHLYSETNNDYFIQSAFQ